MTSSELHNSDIKHFRLFFIIHVDSEEKEEFDATGRKEYLEVCKCLEIVPSSYFLRHMQDSVLSLGHHGIGSLGAKAISFPLMVCHYSFFLVQSMITFAVFFIVPTLFCQFNIIQSVYPTNNLQI